MPKPLGSTYGRAAMLGVLIALLLTISTGVYVFMARMGARGQALGVIVDDPVAETRRLAHLTLLLTILLISVLLILLFVIGCYLVIRVGRYVRSPISGQPTTYVDAWQNYRLTDEQIEAATAEQPPDEDPDRGPGTAGEPPETSR